jgi:hypothetical protein
MTGFIKPDATFTVYSKKGRFYNEEEGFFSCLVSVSPPLYSAGVMTSNWSTTTSNSTVTRQI